MTIKGLSVALIAGVILTACGNPTPAGGALPPPSDVTTPSTTPPTSPPTTGPGDTVGSNGPFDSSATMQPDLMVVEPSVVGYGERVTVTYPGGRDRGIAYVLEWERDGEWHTTHLLTATTDGYGTEPGWVPYGTDGYGWDDIGISGQGPDHLIIPGSALAGDYRICTANSRENICAPVTIVKPDDAEESGSESILTGVLGDADPVAEFVGEPLTVFEELVGENGLGPVRVAWRDGEHLALQWDLVPGRVNVAVRTQAGVEVVVDARVEASGALGLGAAIAAVYEGVGFYPACGNETLEHEGVVWHQVNQFEYPEVYDRIVDESREEPPPSVTVRGFAARVAEPGPGDDVGTLVVWDDGVGYFVSDSGDLYAWLVQDELIYNWVC